MKWWRNQTPILSWWIRICIEQETHVICVHIKVWDVLIQCRLFYFCAVYIYLVLHFYAQWLRYCLLLHIFSLILFEVDYFKTDFQHLSSIEYYLSAKWFLDNRPNSEPFVYLVIWNVQTLSEILNFSVDVVKGGVFLLHGAHWEEVVMCWSQLMCWLKRDNRVCIFPMHILC